MTSCGRLTGREQRWLPSVFADQYGGAGKALLSTGCANDFMNKCGNQ